ncbi:MAG: hypothetical protein IJH99_00680 [Eubacterium sp.]|nr:hypothetical protein [Eubacterium sp.]
MDTAVKRNALRLVLLAAAAVLVIAGIAARDPAAVWSKAAKICLECIGLG